MGLPPEARLARGRGMVNDRLDREPPAGIEEGACGGSGSAGPPPPPPGAGRAPAQADALYKQYGGSCHGPDGKGNGPAAAALPVKPADHTNPAVMGKISDAELFRAIKEGGQAVGKSPARPPWGGTLKEEQIHALVAHVRSLAKSR